MHLTKGKRLRGGTYEIVKFIANGGFGCTYEAVHLLLKKRCAIKEFFVQDFCGRAESTGVVSFVSHSKRPLLEHLRQKFLEEAQMVAGFDHPNIVRVTDVFKENGTAYFVMDYIDGYTVGDHIKRYGKMSEAESLKVMGDVCDALEYVHSHDVLHLDIKPANIMLDAAGNAILIDFGVSKQYDELDGENTSAMVCMTPGYAPPEQNSHSIRKFEPATDIYALGATLYKMLSGITPLDHAALQAGAVQKPLPEDISSHVRKAVEKAMRLRRDERPQSVAEFRRLLHLSQKQEEKTIINVKYPDEDRTKIIETDRRKQSDGYPEIVATPRSAKSYRRESSPWQSFTVNGVKFNMIPVMGGRFMMGATRVTEDAKDAVGGDEFPVHQVTLKDYYISEVPVTQRLWEAVMGKKMMFFTNNPSAVKGPRLPVTNVSWDDCQEFIARLNRLTDKEFRLPTEAEWEFAARGGVKSQGFVYSGSDLPDEVAWYGENSAKKIYSPANLQPNELGIYDMSGNVSEWCADYYGDYPHNAQMMPKGPTEGERRVIRGGGYLSAPEQCRVSARDHDEATATRPTLGFRLALTSR